MRLEDKEDFVEYCTLDNFFRDHFNLKSSLIKRDEDLTRIYREEYKLKERDCDEVCFEYESKHMLKGGVVKTPSYQCKYLDGMKCTLPNSVRFIKE